MRWPVRNAVSLKAGLALSLPVFSGSIALALPAPTTQQIAQQILLFPAPGVVCDQRTQRCYDARGLSSSLTGQQFSTAARQNAFNTLRGRRPPQLFTLSDGSSCDLRQRVCYGQPQINQQITNQLFGGLLGPYPYPSTTPYPDTTLGQTDYTGDCSITRGGNLVYQGSCALKEVQQGLQPRFEVQLQNGARYIFEQSQGGYQISDSMGGRWPVQFSDYGRSGQFRWADMTLTVTQRNYRPETNPGGSFGRAIENFLIDLFN